MSRAPSASPNLRWNPPALPLIAVVVGLSGACARVSPYERETLARRDMELTPGADLVAGEQHARDYREGSSGGAEVSGGGCGCN